MSSDHFHTLSVQQNLNRLARAKAIEAIQQTGRALPCSVTAVDGSFVTVEFQVTSHYTLPPLTLPKAESQWLRNPTQIGDVGVTLPADTSLAGITQGGPVADLDVSYGNLTTLVFVPTTATSFSVTPDNDKVWANGPHGARIGDASNVNYIDIDTLTDTITIKAGTQTWTFSAAGLTLSTNIVAETHKHGGIQTGSSETLGPRFP